MNINDNDFYEYHKHIKRERDQYKAFVRDIYFGERQPTMMDDPEAFKQMTLAEIKKRAKELVIYERKSPL